jgi:hypothetical protein
MNTVVGVTLGVAVGVGVGDVHVGVGVTDEGVTVGVTVGVGVTNTGISFTSSNAVSSLNYTTESNNGVVETSPVHTSIQFFIKH